MYASKLFVLASDNGVSPSQRQVIIWTNDGILLIRNLGTNVSEIDTFVIQDNAFENVVCETVAILSRPQCVNWPKAHSPCI